MLNGATRIALTKTDIVFPSVKGVKKYADLPRDALDFVESIEREVKVPVTLIGTGPAVEEVIDRRIG